MTYFRETNDHYLDERPHKLKARGAGAPSSDDVLAEFVDVVLCDLVIELLNADENSEGR